LLQVREREFTDVGDLDETYIEELRMRHGSKTELPPGRTDNTHRLAYIIPPSLPRHLKANTTACCDQENITISQVMLRNWTGISEDELTRGSIESPKNDVFMTGMNYRCFARFTLYFDASEVCPIAWCILHLNLDLI